MKNVDFDKLYYENSSEKNMHLNDDLFQWLNQTYKVLHTIV